MFFDSFYNSSKCFLIHYYRFNRFFIYLCTRNTSLAKRCILLALSRGSQLCYCVISLCAFFILIFVDETNRWHRGGIYVRLFYKIDFIIALLALSITELSNEAK